MNSKSRNVYFSVMLLEYDPRKISKPICLVKKKGKQIESRPLGNQIFLKPGMGEQWFSNFSPGFLEIQIVGFLRVSDLRTTL